MGCTCKCFFFGFLMMIMMMIVFFYFRLIYYWILLILVFQHVGSLQNIYVSLYWQFDLKKCQQIFQHHHHYHHQHRQQQQQQQRQTVGNNMEQGNELEIIYAADIQSKIIKKQTKKSIHYYYYYLFLFIINFCSLYSSIILLYNFFSFLVGVLLNVFEWAKTNHTTQDTQSQYL